MTGYSENAVAIFSRNGTTGTLTYVEMVQDSAGGVDGLAYFRRNEDTGALTWAGTLKDGEDGKDGLDGAYAVAASPGGGHVYAVGYEENALVDLAKRTHRKVDLSQGIVGWRRWREWAATPHVGGRASFHQRDLCGGIWGFGPGSLCPRPFRHTSTARHQKLAPFLACHGVTISMKNRWGCFAHGNRLSLTSDAADRVEHGYPDRLLS